MEESKADTNSRIPFVVLLHVAFAGTGEAHAMTRLVEHSGENRIWFRAFARKNSGSVS